MFSLGPPAPTRIAGPPAPTRIAVVILGALCVAYWVMGNADDRGDFGSGDGMAYLPALPPPPPPSPPPPSPPPPPPRPLSTYSASTLTPLTSAATGLVVGASVLFALTSALDPCDHPPVIQDGSHIVTFDDRITCRKAGRLIGLGGLAVIDVLSDACACRTFFQLGATCFFYASLAILLCSCALGAIVGSAAAGNVHRPYGGLGGALLGLTGLSPLVEACSDVCVGKETSASGATRITYAIAAPGLQAMLQLLYLTAFPSVHDAWTVAPLVVVSAVVSSLSLSLQFATYPATPSGRGRLGGGLTTAHDALSAQLAAQRANVDSAAGGCAWWPLDFTMSHECRESSVATVALLLYFAADLGLRALTLAVYAAESDATYALAAYALANAAVASLSGDAEDRFGHRNLTALLCAVGGCFAAILPFMGNGVHPTHVKADFILSTLTCASLAFVGLYAPGAPHPHVDPIFVTPATTMIAAAVGCKAAAFVWYVFPAVFPVQHLYKPVDELLSA